MNHEYQYLVGKLQEALAADARVNVLDIRINITQGRVHLTGEVPTEDRRLAIEHVAAELLPEFDVRNDVTVIELVDSPKPEAIDG